MLFMSEIVNLNTKRKELEQKKENELIATAYVKFNALYMDGNFIIANIIFNANSTKARDYVKDNDLDKVTFDIDIAEKLKDILIEKNEEQIIALSSETDGNSSNRIKVLNMMNDKHFFVKIDGDFTNEKTRAYVVAYIASLIEYEKVVAMAYDFYSRETMEKMIMDNGGYDVDFMIVHED